MSVLPGLKRLFDGLSKRTKIIERSAAFVALTANRCLRHVAVAMPKLIIAFAIKLRVLGIGKTSDVQSMGSIEWNPNPEKNGLVVPYFGKKIIALMQAHTMQHRHTCIRLLVNVTSQALCRYLAILLLRDVIELAMIKLRT